MSAWTAGGDPSAWQYQQSQGSLASATQPSTSGDPQFEPWSPAPDYGTSSAPYGEGFEYGITGVDAEARFSQFGQTDSFNISHSSQPPPSRAAPYPSLTYAQPQQEQYAITSHPAVQPRYHDQQYLENPPFNPPYRYGPPPSELPAPSQDVLHLSSTAQRFQNSVQTPTYEPPSNLPPQQQPAIETQIVHPNFTSTSRPIPAPAAIQQYHRKVDELAMLEQRLSQLQSILSRGTMAEPGRPGAAQPILANQRAHLEIQLNEFKNRRLNLLNDCEAFTRHFGPASSWDTSFVPFTRQQQAPPPAGGIQRARTVSAGLQQNVNPPSPNRQYRYGGAVSGSRPSHGPGSAPPQVFSRPHDATFPSAPQEAGGSSPSVTAFPEQQTGYNPLLGPAPVQAQHQHYLEPPVQTTYPPHPSPHQRMNSSPHPGPPLPHPRLASAMQQPSHYPSPSQQPEQPPHQNMPVVSPNLHISNSATYASHLPPTTQAPATHSTHMPHSQRIGPSQLLQHHAVHTPSSRPGQQSAVRAAPSSDPAAGFAPDPQQNRQQVLPRGLQAQMDAITREQAASNGRSRSDTDPKNLNQNPLQVLIKKAESGEMPVMTLTGLRKASDVERERKEEEERERARIANAAKESNGNGKMPMTSLAELCRQGGGPTLAEMVMTIDHQVFWTQLQQTCAARGINVFEEVHQGKFVVETKPVDLLQLFQTVVSRGGGYGKIDAGHAWPHVATLLSISTRSVAGQSRIKEIYHRVLAPFEDVWATQMIKHREKQRAMDEARRVLGAMPAASSTTLSAATRSPLGQGASDSLPNPRLTPSSQPAPLARHSPAQPPSNIAPAPGSSSMFANPIAYNSLPPSDPYPGAPAIPDVAQEPSSLSDAATSVPSEKPVSSSELLEQARTLRQKLGNDTSRGGAASSSKDFALPQQATTNSPTQETSSTPQEVVTSSATLTLSAVAEAADKSSPVIGSIAASNTSKSVNTAPGRSTPVSTRIAQPAGEAPTSASNEEGGGSATASKKRKNAEPDGSVEGAKMRTGKARNRSMSNLEAPVVGQQTNEPHFNPFEINHFLPFTTAPPAVVPSPTVATHALKDFPNVTNSAKSNSTHPSLPSSMSSDTISPQSIVDGPLLSSPGEGKGGGDTLSGSSASNGFEPITATLRDFGHSSLAAAFNPAALDSISLAMSLDPLAASRPGTSWSLQDSTGAKGLSGYDSLSGGLDGYSFQSGTFDDDSLAGFERKHLTGGTDLSGSSSIPNWSPGGLDGFDFGTSFS